MKDLAEIYQALLDGEVLVAEGYRVRLNGGAQECWRDEHGWTNDCRNLAFHSPDEWSIYKEPQWYDDIPVCGVLCRVKNKQVSFWYIDLIIGYQYDINKFSGWGDFWDEAEPLDLNSSIRLQLKSSVPL